MTFVAYRAAFVETEERDDGTVVSDGFDLDGIDSTGLDVDSCNRTDFPSVNPPGEGDGPELGIDNQFSDLWKLIAGLTGDALDGLIHMSISNGEILLMFEVSGVQDWVDDPQVNVAVFAGEGRPLLGADGLLARGQTLDVREDARYASTTQGAIEDGVLVAGPMDVELPVAIFFVTFDLRVNGAMIRAQLDPETGQAVGIIGGGVPIQSIFDLFDEIQDAEQNISMLAPAVRLFLPASADLSPDEEGFCTELSAYLEFGATEAFVYDDSVWPEGRE